MLGLPALYLAPNLQLLPTLAPAPPPPSPALAVTGPSARRPDSPRSLLFDRDPG